MPQIDLPTFYYHDHFMEMLDFVGSVYAGVLQDTHRSFIALFRGLNKPERCLYVRMANRKGQVFRISSLSYAEIETADKAVARLKDRGLAAAVTPDIYRDVLLTMTKDDLVALIESACLQGVKQSWTKTRLLDFIHGTLPFDTWCDLSDPDAYIAQRQKHVVDFLLYLYFGKTTADLKSFALRDLGIVRTSEQASFKARFADAAEAHACFFYSQLLDRLDARRPETFETAAAAFEKGTEAPTDYAMSLRTKAGFVLASFFEKQKDTARAISLYECAPCTECNERLVRLLYADGQKDRAKALLERMIDDPGSDEEHIFASDFYGRKFNGQRLGTCTGLLRGSVGIAVDEIHRNAPEAGAASLFRRADWRPYRTENVFWHGLFGLLFWDQLFDDDSLLHSSFDRLPHCLKDGSFSLLFRNAIAEKLDAIRQGKALNLMLKTVAAHWDRPNGLFNWNTIDIESLRDFFAHAEPDAMAAMIDLLCRDFNSLRDGFPDLMLARDGIIKFVEIKAEGDSIRRNQLTRLRQLQRAGFAAEICRVDYRYDPDQTYVVVDVETTGGRAASERVTEIGAVKIRNHQVVGEFHSLVNPQRPIPAYITKLTGIANNMVRDAPVFAALADGLSGFMEHAVFAAHNVNFDYSFIASEYRRLDRDFRFPKVCTCAGMRRHYPGHASYSLGNLCEIYGIGLEAHHRALCDARAAGQLLSLINRRREKTAMAA